MTYLNRQPQRSDAGGYLISALGWKYVFVFLGLMAIFMLLASVFKLPESYTPDPDYSLKPKPILTNFFTVLKEPQFYTYAFSGSIAFSGLFTYVAASPILFMTIFKAKISKKLPV